MRLQRIPMAALTILALACGGGSSGPTSPPAPPPPPPPPPAPNTVVIAGTNFNPPTLTVAVNTTVTFQFQQGGHNVTFEDNISNSASDVGAGTNHLREFTARGTYRYRCTIHSSGFGNSGEMVGQITVQ
ncbi:MAG: plastocyanin/azurin family copper-binding protein [Gemmatimonadales bacterium]